MTEEITAPFSTKGKGATNQETMNPTPEMAANPNDFLSPRRAGGTGNRAIRLELLFLGALLLLLNLPLLQGAFDSRLTFLPDRFLAGEWWRAITHPFVHVSSYHLALDGAAFLMLYAELSGWSTARRLAAFAACALGSLLGALASPFIASRGLCGLSGVAHGFMALSAFQMIQQRDRRERILGGVMLTGLLLKCAYEGLTGRTPFASLHLGSVGFPIVACHAGGAIAGLVFALIDSQRRGRTDERTK